MIKLAMRLFLIFSILNLIIPQQTIQNYSDYGWAIFLNNIGETTKAKDILLKHKDKNVYYYNKLGEFEKTDYEKALFYFKKGEKADSENPSILKNLGKTYFFLFFRTKKNSDMDNAKKYLNKYLKYNKNDFFINYIYGEALKFSGEYTKGVEYLINAYQLNPSATRILNEIIKIKISLKDYFWIILNYKQFKILKYINTKDLENILNFIEKLQIKPEDKNYSKVIKFINAVNPSNNISILKKLIIINFKNKKYSKIVNLYLKNRSLLSETDNTAITRFYLFSLYYSRNYYEFSKEINKRIKQNPGSNFLKYLLSRYYYQLGYKKIPYLLVKNIKKPSFITDKYYKNYLLIVKIRYRLSKKDKNSLKKLINNISPEEIKRMPNVLKIYLLKAAVLIKNETLIKELLKEKNYYLNLVYITNTESVNKIIKYIKTDKKKITVIFSELISNNRIDDFYTILKKTDKKEISSAKYYFYTGRYYELKKDYKKAHNYYKKMIDEECPLSYLNYYTYFSLQHNFKIKNRTKIIKRFTEEGKSAAVFDTLGLLLIKSNNKNKGEEYLLKAYTYTPEDKLIKMHLADYYYNIGNYKKALFFYEKSLEGECFTNEFEQNLKRIKKRIKELKKINFNIKNFSGIYSIKIYNNGDKSSLRLRIRYKNNRLLLTFYHFPMTKIADIFSNGNTITINYKKKKFYEGQLKEIIENLIGVDFTKDDILNLFGIKEGINFIPYKEIKIDSYKKGFPEKIEIKGEKLRIRIKLLKIELKKEIMIKKPNVEDFNEVFDIREVFSE